MKRPATSACFRLKRVLAHIAFGVIATVGVSWGVRHWHFTNGYPSGWVVQRAFLSEEGGRAWRVISSIGTGRWFYQVTVADAAAAGPYDSRFLRILELEHEDAELVRARERLERAAQRLRESIEQSPEQASERFHADVADISRPGGLYDWILATLDAPPFEVGRLPAWIARPARRSGPQTMVSTAYGWPAPALVEEIRSPYRFRGERLWILSPGAPGAQRISRARPIQRPQEFGFPLRPAWPGCFVNVALYAGLSWLPFFVAAKWTRSRRRKLGRCRGCGYSVVGTPVGAVCPECGREP